MDRHALLYDKIRISYTEIDDLRLVTEEAAITAYEKLHDEQVAFGVKHVLPASRRVYKVFRDNQFPNLDRLEDIVFDMCSFQEIQTSEEQVMNSIQAIQSLIYTYDPVIHFCVLLTMQSPILMGLEFEERKSIAYAVVEENIWQ